MITMSKTNTIALLSPLLPVVDLAEILKALVQLSREQGHLTDDDINDILPIDMPDGAVEELYRKLRDLGIKVVELANIEQAKTAGSDEDSDPQLATFDDPVRMYMNKMGRVPLLTRAQEVEICQRIEQVEIEISTLLYGLGFMGKEHIALGEKLLAEPPKERFDRVVALKGTMTRKGHLKKVPQLIKKIQGLDEQADKNYLARQSFSG